MSNEQLKLVAPNDALREAFIAFKSEFAEAGERDIPGIGPMKATDFATALRRCDDEANGRNLTVGWVPGSTFWLVREGRTIVATSNLRHRLNESLQYENGQIGYSVRPGERRKGYGTLVLSLTLNVARQMGISRVLVTCDKDNPGSAGVILHNGGVLENEVVSKTTGKIVQRYWITL